MREGEKIRGGFVVMARTKTGMLDVHKGRHPFEHGTIEAAANEAERLSESNAGKTFSVWAEIKRSDNV